MGIGCCPAADSTQIPGRGYASGPPGMGAHRGPTNIPSKLRRNAPSSQTCHPLRFAYLYGCVQLAGFTKSARAHACWVYHGKHFYNVDAVLYDRPLCFFTHFSSVSFLALDE
ncbi:hypothetical protein PGT21_001632 [Puccinia graminis f. sp. tritici]|uniref:Uncharacterized protein n=1 Tax=Puccinia graminis f. sp. tritici TaxID=56615 RepID=A0A5B0QHB5_PUCGR|nr:hypothetical protein PGT21_001632 [Puccinia graminis f. sp. tritici]KAA1134807.1 hypothetical protein PGTUg99_012670 [Puccinia graminis f. sp. tritici]